MKQVATGFAVLLLLVAGTAMLPAGPPQEASVYPAIALFVLLAAGHAGTPAPDGNQGTDVSVLQVER
ncbi:hypothetical protein [Methanoculleus sp. UBA430]|nr:hypothetical protein [Methanoculleus sp. UBA430]